MSDTYLNSQQKLCFEQNQNKAYNEKYLCKKASSI